MLATVFFGNKGAVCSCLAQASVLIAIGVAQRAGAFAWSADTLLFSMSAIEGLALSVMTAFAQFYLIGGLRRSIDARGTLATKSFGPISSRGTIRLRGFLTERISSSSWLGRSRSPRGAAEYSA